MGRLKSVTDKDGNITEYEFDSFGNISKEYDISERDIKTKQYFYDNNNRLIMSDSQSETIQYEYDDAGNLIEATTGYGGRIKKTYYRYDGYNRLNEYISDDVISEYTYNLDGLRESKTVGGKYTRFMYDGGNIIGELTEGNYYIYHRGTELIGSESYDGKSYYFRQDSHGNVTGILDVFGSEIKNYSYNPYGGKENVRLDPMGDRTIIYQWKAETDKIYNPFDFCGEYFDEETGLIYLRNRYYNPNTGRFITEDPVKDGLNWYIYCENNPVMFVDPWGLDPYVPFSTRDEAAIDFGLYIGQKSMDVEEEFAACIYKKIDKNGNKYYFYDIPRNDLEDHETRKINFSISWDGTYGQPVAITHTHGAYDANTENMKDVFSSAGNVASGDDEESDAYWSDKNNIDYYLISPNGNLKLYVANSGNYIGELINSDMPIDKRIELHQHMQNTLLWRLLQINYKEAKPQDFVNARLKHPDNLLDMVNELERFR